jgi:hypothetical protein
LRAKYPSKISEIKLKRKQQKANVDSSMNIKMKKKGAINNLEIVRTFGINSFILCVDIMVNLGRNFLEIRKYFFQLES